MWRRDTYGARRLRARCARQVRTCRRGWLVVSLRSGLSCYETWPSGDLSCESALPLEVPCSDPDARYGRRHSPC
ncbi:unnamed protein product [[Actinomadura] parvosata subsp. kistnae]|nr:unnamed protein product [Actinomadura parvosata subsp. kistnae]